MLSPHHCLMLQLFARFLPQRKQARFLAICFFWLIFFNINLLELNLKTFITTFRLDSGPKESTQNKFTMAVHRSGKITEIKTNLFFHLADALEGLPPLRDIALRHYSASSAIALRQQYQSAAMLTRVRPIAANGHSYHLDLDLVIHITWTEPF